MSGFSLKLNHPRPDRQDSAPKKGALVRLHVLLLSGLEKGPLSGLSVACPVGSNGFFGTTSGNCGPGAVATPK
jgi:hypothetical protein